MLWNTSILKIKRLEKCVLIKCHFFREGMKKKQALKLSWAITIIIEYSNRTYNLYFFFSFFRNPYFHVRYVIWLYMGGLKKYITNYS